MNINKGMYIEKLIENTILYYSNNNICFIEKRYLPIQILKRNEDIITGKLLKKSYVDFVGIVDKKYVAFEAKQTDLDFFELKQIKKHQLDHLQLINKLNGISFLVLHFYHYDKTFLIAYECIEKWISKSMKKIKIFDMKNNNNIYELNIVFPGILNLYEKIKNLV